MVSRQHKPKPRKNKRSEKQISQPAVRIAREKNVSFFIDNALDTEK